MDDPSQIDLLTALRAVIEVSPSSHRIALLQQVAEELDRLYHLEGLARFVVRNLGPMPSGGRFEPWHPKVQELCLMLGLQQVVQPDVPELRKAEP